MPYYVIVDKKTGARLREGVTLKDLHVSDPDETEQIDARDRARKEAFEGTPTIADVHEINRLKDEDRKAATGRLLDPETEELETFADIDVEPDGNLKTWDAANRVFVDVLQRVVEVPVDPKDEQVLAFRGVFTAEQSELIRKLVQTIAPKAVEE